MLGFIDRAQKTNRAQVSHAKSLVCIGVHDSKRREENEQICVALLHDSELIPHR